MYRGFISRAGPNGSPAVTASTPSATALADTPSANAPRSIVKDWRTHSTPDLVGEIQRSRVSASLPPPPPTPPFVTSDPAAATSRAIARSKSWTETIFSPLFNVVPFLRPESEDESPEGAAAKSETRIKLLKTSSTSSLTADETLESSEPEPEAREVTVEPAAEGPPRSAYEAPAAYTLEEVEEIEVFDPYAFLS
jgi:hypothetical protein